MGVPEVDRARRVAIAQAEFKAELSDWPPEETDRYIADPGQALAYKLGQLKFLELRERAKQELGDKFDIRAFHDKMLDGGALPLDMLDARTNAWIAALKANAVAVK